jgi:hypothetical protein
MTRPLRTLQYGARERSVKGAAKAALSIVQ